MYAVIQTGGKQYRVSEGDILRVELLDGDPHVFELGGELAHERLDREERADAVPGAGRGRRTVPEERHLDLQRRLDREAARG